MTKLGLPKLASLLLLFFCCCCFLLFCFRPQRKGDSYGKDEMKGQEIDRKEGEVKVKVKLTKSISLPRVHAQTNTKSEKQSKLLY